MKTSESLIARVRYLFYRVVSGLGARSTAFWLAHSVDAILKFQNRHYGTAFCVDHPVTSRTKRCNVIQGVPKGRADADADSEEQWSKMMDFD
jgi:hypothetical protein